MLWLNYKLLTQRFINAFLFLLDIYSFSASLSSILLFCSLKRYSLKLHVIVCDALYLKNNKQFELETWKLHILNIFLKKLLERNEEKTIDLSIKD